eukprot:TCALIF_05675-PA protein Name:"Similar to SLC22A7 Solute carrier family 22 member 7 (Oryctolagus cuniculus)" AED:0.14 eAED:0.14 QI:0/0/0/0.6/1/1/5/0/556
MFMTLNFDDVLENTLGGFGRWQFLLYVAGGLLLFPCKLYIPIFLGFLPRYRCKVLECDLEPKVEFHPTWAEFAIPHLDNNYLHDGLGHCQRFSSNGTSCSKFNFDEHHMVPCSQSVYDDSMMKEPMVAFFDIGPCSSNDPNWWLGSWISQMAFIEIIFWTGVMIGILVCGRMGDRYGTRVVILTSQVTFTVGAIIAFTSMTYSSYVISSLLTGFGCMGSSTSPYVLVSEVMGKNHRHYLAFYQIFRVLGGFSYAWVASVLQNWRQFWLYALCVNLAVSPIWFWLHDSPRWLLSRGQFSQARKVLDFATKINGEPRLSANDFAALQEASRQQNASNRIHERMWTNYYVLRNLVVCLFIWLSVGLMYLGLSRISVTLGGNIYENFALFEGAELIGLVLSSTVASYMDCRTLIVWSLGSGSLALVLSFLIGHPMWTLALVVLGKTWASMSLQVIYVYTPAIFPTPIRNSALGLSSTAARLGALIGAWLINSKPSIKRIFSLLCSRDRAKGVDLASKAWTSSSDSNSLYAMESVRNKAKILDEPNPKTTSTPIVVDIDKH